MALVDYRNAIQRSVIAGFIVTDELMRTSASGIFAASDVRQNSFRQVITAAGDGAAAASSALKYLYK